VANTSPWRKQTLLGIAPVIPPRSEPPAASAPTAPATPSAHPAPTDADSPAVGTPLIAASNPLRKQTLLGLAPVIEPRSEPPQAAPVEAAPVVEPEAPAAEMPVVAAPAADPASLVTPAAVATDAPTTLDVGMSEPQLPVATKPVTAPVIETPPTSGHDLPELKPKRPRWLVPLGIAATIGLGVVGLRALDKPPALPPPPVGIQTPANPIVKPGQVAPKSDDDGDDGPSTDQTPTPDPTPPQPDPLQGAAAPSGASAAASAAAAPQAPAGDAPAATSPGMVSIKIESDPPGARLFRKGKEVGTTPFTLEFEPGQRRAYELVRPGYGTRKVVIDGSKTEISIGLKPDPSAPPGAKPRK
jgi:hypothetical protein